MKTTIYSFLLISIFVISCKKDGTNDVAFEGGITITSPNAGDTISGTQTIVTGSITGNMDLHGYHVVLYKASDNSILAETEVDHHSSSITLHDTLVYSVSQLTPVRLHVESAYNHEGDMTTKDVNYVIQP
jgi:hypothetical protein